MAPVLPTLMTPDSLLVYMRKQLGMKLSTDFELDFLVEEPAAVSQQIPLATFTTAATTAGTPAADQTTLSAILSAKKHGLK